MQIQLLLTGNEVMAGDTIDSNSAAIAEYLGEQGWRIYRKVTVGDELDLLCQEIEAQSAAADVLIINGGLGPTIDDMTAEALAEVTGRPLEQHGEALKRLTLWCERLGLTLNKANLKQTILPKNCDLIRNATGSAEGMALEHNNCLILATPGVPRELREMMASEIIPMLKARFGSDFVETRRLAVFGEGESTLQQGIDDLISDWPANIELGFRASMPLVEVKLTARGKNLSQQLDACEAQMKQFLGDAFIGHAPVTLAEATLSLYRAQGKTLTTAESCTGGAIAAALTEVAGASDTFLGGWVCYSNAMKQAQLGVPEQTIAADGAVSEAVARAMLSGALQRSGADAGVAVTGIAGPNGGTEDKPVGSVWLAWGTAEDMQAEFLVVNLGRKRFQNLVTAIGIDLLRRHSGGLERLPGFAARHLQAGKISR